jgi:hypothetical protein
LISKEYKLDPSALSSIINDIEEIEKPNKGYKTLLNDINEMIDMLPDTIQENEDKLKELTPLKERINATKQKLEIERLNNLIKEQEKQLKKHNYLANIGLQSALNSIKNSSISTKYIDKIKNKK